MHANNRRAPLAWRAALGVLVFLLGALPMQGQGSPCFLLIDVFRVVSGKYQQTGWPQSNPNAACKTGAAVGACKFNQQVPQFSWGKATIDPNQKCGG